jgi:hypothetical protein
MKSLTPVNFVSPEQAIDNLFNTLLDKSYILNKDIYRAMRRIGTQEHFSINDVMIRDILNQNHEKDNVG